VLSAGLARVTAANGTQRPTRTKVHSRTKRLRERAIVAVLLGCALRRCAVAAPTDGRCSAGFTPEATAAARHADTPELEA